MTRRRLLRAALTVQLVGVAALVVWWAWPEPGADTPEAAFELLLTAVRDKGAAPAVGVLGAQLLDDAVAACNRDVCIAARFEGQHARWALATAASGRDACAGERHPACTESAVRHQLSRVLEAARSTGCRVESTQADGPRPGVRVRCGAVADFVRMERGPGGWRIVASERSPGLLPDLYRGLAAE